MVTIDAPRGVPVLRAVVAVFLSIAGLLAGCGAPPESAAVYRHSLDGRVSNLDPIRASTIYANHLVVNLYDTLYGYRYLARPYELVPNLARAMPEVSEDGLVYTIQLKRGVHFIDDPAFVDGLGREVVAADFVYSFDRHFAPNTLSQGAWLWADDVVVSVTAPARYTVRIELARPFPQLVHTLAQGFAAVVPREAVETYGPAFAVHPVGSGPFRLVSLDASRAVLERNPRFRREAVDLAALGYDPALHAGYGLERLQGRNPPFVDRLEVWFAEEGQSRWESFVKGDEIQYLLVPGRKVPEALAMAAPARGTGGADAAGDGAQGGDAAGRATPDAYYRLTVPALELIFHTFNFEFPALGDPSDDPARRERNRSLRCAMVRSFDWQRRNELFYNGVATVFPGAIPPGVPEFDPEAPRDYVTRDLDEARALLARAGADGAELPTLEYGYPASTVQGQFFEEFRAFLVEAGYPLSRIVPRAYPNFGAFAQALKRSEIMISYKSWTLDYPDAQNVLQQFYGPNRAPGSNDGNYANPRYDQLYEQAATLPPGPERTALYRRMNALLMEDCAIIGGLARTHLLMWHDDVILYPDRNVTGGYALRYVALAPRAGRGDAATGD